MSIKSANVVKHLEAKGRVIVKLDRASGLTSITITRREFDRFVVGRHPGSIVRSLTRAEVEALLAENSMYIKSWS